MYQILRYSTPEKNDFSVGKKREEKAFRKSERNLLNNHGHRWCEENHLVARKGGGNFKLVMIKSIVAARPNRLA